MDTCAGTGRPRIPIRRLFWQQIRHHLIQGFVTQKLRPNPEPSPRNLPMQPLGTYPSPRNLSQPSKPIGTYPNPRNLSQP
eukprot:1345248-Amorphochlora_amoeboformis.AAC.1